MFNFCDLSQKWHKSFTTTSYISDPALSYLSPWTSLPPSLFMFNRPSLGFPPGPPRQDSDAPIRQTDSDAAIARLSAAQKHYIHDPFVRHLVPRAQFQHPRPPLINIGTYVRTKGIDDLVEEWLKLAENNGKQCQIVSLGAGSDTRFWRIATGPHKDTIRSYIEVDFAEITSKKSMSIKKSKELMEVLGNPEDIKLERGGAVLHSPKYHLLAADLRSDPVKTLQDVLTKCMEGSDEPILSPHCPTLLLFECVLAYMAIEVSSRLLRWFVNYFSAEGEVEAAQANGPLGCIIYEMFGLDDSFGRVMLSNLRARNVTLPGAEPLTTLDSLVARFLGTGFHGGLAVTLKEIRKSFIEPEELARISRLEMLDETEELELVLAHYAISWGILIPNPADNEVWNNWKLSQKEKREEEHPFGLLHTT
ncbi:LCM-domain-containing protein [Macrolepiota fuliginosa MF-IS2]|uniref:Leucine carboxyl methyltransferase 1 n=1 Tax=Macrolepiota fuliginosa MF-IS2 TaxID=1400762 RepID=A0A9P6BZQ8_9AGAR|nr:LCM-domain-containing protein [Macrolepiota fuliginosa MF-IS2]